MSQRQRFLALLEVYDEAIQELYVLGDSRFLDLILRLERRHRETAARLGELDRFAAIWADRSHSAAVG
jgi:hypothetical protein